MLLKMPASSTLSVPTLSFTGQWRLAPFISVPCATLSNASAAITCPPSGARDTLKKVSASMRHQSTAPASYRTPPFTLPACDSPDDFAPYASATASSGSSSMRTSTRATRSRSGSQTNTESSDSATSLEDILDEHLFRTNTNKTRQDHRESTLDQVLSGSPLARNFATTHYPRRARGRSQLHQRIPESSAPPSQLLSPRQSPKGKETTMSSETPEPYAFPLRFDPTVYLYDGENASQSHQFASSLPEVSSARTAMQRTNTSRSLEGSSLFC